MPFSHTSVLLRETIDALKVKPDGVYVDCTLGGGGHAEALLSRRAAGGGRLCADPLRQLRPRGEPARSGRRLLRRAAAAPALPDGVRLPRGAALGRRARRAARPEMRPVSDRKRAYLKTGLF